MISRMSDQYAVDAEFYDLVQGRTGDDIALWRSFATQTAAPILEVGAGTGRIAVALAADAQVTGIDPSPAMLAIAADEAAKAGVNLVLIEGLVTEAALPADTFGLIVVPADVFLYCENTVEQIDMLHGLRDCMTADGTLAIDVAGPALWPDPASNGQPVSVFHSRDKDGTALDVWHLHDDDLGSQTRHLRVTYEVTGAEGVVTRRQSLHRLRYVYPLELQHLLERSGFELSGPYGDYDLGPLTNDSERMIVVARGGEG